MLKEKQVSTIIDQLCSPAFINTFNPYKDRCEVFDKDTAPEMRKEILRGILLEASSGDVDSIWIGRDLGHRGGRRTGLALTDDFSFLEHISRWSVVAERPSLGQPVKERTASVIWDVLRKINVSVFLWNVFPYHPYPSDNAFGNRAHNAAERNFGVGILKSIIALLEPKTIIALGNDAAKVAEGLKLSQKTYHVRHPSFGGHNEFIHQISGIYKINNIIKQGQLL